MSVQRRGILSDSASRLALLSLGTCALAASSCQRDAAATEGPPLVRRLELAPTRPLEAQPARQVERIQVPDELPDTWIVKAESFEVVHEADPDLGGPWTGLAMHEVTAGQVKIPGRFDPATFNRVAITLRMPYMIDVGVRFFRNGEVVLNSEPLRIPGERHGTTTVIVDVPQTIQHDAPFQAIGFYYRKLSADPTLIALDLLRTPLRQWLPDASSGPEPVAIGEEFRDAVGLSSESSLTSEWSVIPGSTLRFGYGRPLPVRRKGERPSILVEVEAGETRLRRELPLVVEGAGADRWTDATIDLSSLAGDTARATFSLVGTAGAESLCALATPFIARPGEHPRTVVLVTSDTHRADHIGAHGGPEPAVQTPFLDGLAARGVLFEDCFSSTNITNPSHASILTAISPRDTGMINNVTVLAAPAETLAEAFQAAGFRTIAAVSAGHMRHTQSGLGQGFDRMHAPSGQADLDGSVTVDLLSRWVDDADGLPLFVWLHVFDAHAPYEVPEELQFLYYDRGIDRYDPALPPLPPVAQAQWDPDVRDLEWFLSQYKSEVTYLDGQLERFLDRPRFRDAVIAVTADHGESLGNHEIYFTHKGLFPDTLAVPLIMSWPDAPAGTRVEDPVCQLDLGRTLLDLAGLGEVAFAGRSLVRWIEDPDHPREPRFAISSHGHAASIELDGWFLVLSMSGHRSPNRVKHQVELYDLGRDPTCNQDLVDAEPERARKLRALLLEWLAAARDEGLSRSSAHQDTEMLEQLAALGYATDEPEAPRGKGWYEPDPDDPWCSRFE